METPDKSNKLLVRIKNWGGDVPVLGKARRFSYKDCNGRLAFFGLTDAEARAMLASIALAGEGHQVSAPVVKDGNGKSGKGAPDMDLLARQAKAAPVPSSVGGPLAPLTEEEMLDADDPSVTVTQGKDVEAELEKAVAEAATPPEKPKRKPRKSRKAKATAAKEVNGGLAPADATPMHTGPDSKDAPWEEKEKAEGTKKAPTAPSEMDAGDANDEDEEYEKAEREAIQSESRESSNGGLKIDMVVLKNRPKLRSVLSYLIECGCESPESVVAKCLELKDEVPVLKRIADLSERIPRTLEIMGWPEE